MSQSPLPQDYNDPCGALLRKTVTVKQPLLVNGNTTLMTEANANGVEHGPFYYVKTVDDLIAELQALKAQYPGQALPIWKDDGKYYFFPMKPETHKQTADRRIAEECSSSQ